MWVKTTLEKFAEYGINITTQRQLLDGEYIMHMELTEYPEFFLSSRFDINVIILTTEQMNELLNQEEKVVVE